MLNVHSGRLILFLLLLAPAGSGYSVLTHEAIIDSAWDDSIRPVLLQRFPSATPDEMRKAHAYAYGGAIIQDLGYYPFGSRFFSDLVHYVRSGDFILHLLVDAQDLNELAFALGALAHSAADDQGHSIATNRAVADLYPKLRAKYGNTVSYEDDPVAHLKVEFGFDVSQVAHNHYAPDAYHSFIGFEVSKPLLQRAFRETYDLEFDSMFLSVDLALGSYRRTVSGLIPLMTKVAWSSKRQEIEALTPGVTRHKFIYNLSRASYRRDWGKDYKEPGVGAKFLAFLFRILPKVGPLRSFQFQPLNAQTEKLFAQSFNSTLDKYRVLLKDAQAGKVKLPNTNFDTGKPVLAGEYRLTDEAYAKLLDKLASNKFEGLEPELRRNILDFYAHAVGPVSTKSKPADWEKLQKQLHELENESILGKEKAN